MNDEVALTEKTAPGVREKPAIRRVLVASIRSGVRRAFESGFKALARPLDFELEFVTAGATALERLRDRPYAALVLDGELDDVTATSIFQQAIDQNPSTVGFLYTDRWDDMLQAAVRQMGFHDCVTLEEAYQVDFARRVMDSVDDGRTPPPTRDTAALPIYQRFLDILRAPAVVVDDQATIVYSNPAFRDAAGLGHADPIGRRLGEFFPEVGPSFLRKSGDRPEVLLDLRRASGNIRAVATRIVKFEEDGAAFVGLVFCSE